MQKLIDTLKSFGIEIPEVMTGKNVLRQQKKP